MIPCKEVDLSISIAESSWPSDSFFPKVFGDGEDCFREETTMDWSSLPIYDEYHEKVQEPTYDEELEDDLNEEYHDGDCGVESFDIQPTMTAQEDEMTYSMVVVGKDEEPTTHLPNDDQSLIERFNGLIS